MYVQGGEKIENIPGEKREAKCGLHMKRGK